MKEIFKDVPGYHNLYQISNLSNVKSLRFGKNKILKQRIDTHGYFSLGLTKDGKQIKKQVHQLVAMAFLNHKPCGFKLVVDHKDFNKLNNNVNNLQIVTHRKNGTKDKWRYNYSSNYVGVSYIKKANKWQSQILINGVNKYLGLFKTELEASKAYKKALSYIKF